MANRRAINKNKTSNKSAIRIANGAIFKETGGRKLTTGPKDAKLRERWMDAYVAAGGEIEETKPAGKEPSCTVETCPLADLIVTIVSKSNNKPIEGATIKIEGPTNVSRTSDANGRTMFSAIAPGSYKVTGKHRSYFSTGEGETTVAVSKASTNTADLKLDASVVFITPGKDPINSPNSTPGNHSINEFTYSVANPGVLTIELRAKVEPGGNANAWKNRVKFKVEAVGSSILAWDGGGNGNPTKVNGDFLETSVTFTGLPAKNADFGIKKAELLVDGSVIDSREFEVFFPRDAKNHPGGDANAPNWFHYYSEVAAVASLKYAGASGSVTLAQVRGMTMWSYAAAPDKTSLFIHDETVTASPYQPYGCGVQVSGIDGFVATAVHENMHIQQIARADPLVPSIQCWRHGYSWNAGANHNHYGPGPDGKWGPAPGVATAAVSQIPPFVAGQGDDVALDASDHWPTAFGAQPAAFAANPGLHPIEREAVHASDALVAADHTFARQDWSDPGKNHGTLNRWDD